MKTKFILLVAIFSFILFSSSVLACISSPYIETKNNSTVQIPIESYVDTTGRNVSYQTSYCNKVWFDLGEYGNETLVINRLNSLKEGCGFSTSDVSFLTEFVINGYSVKEQNDQEYEIFLQEANQSNQGRPNDCLDYLATSHKDRWTGFIRSGRDYRNGECIRYKCSNVFVNIIWNDLLPIGNNLNDSANKQDYSKYYYFGAVIVIIFLIILIIKFRKK